jgi:hypothetical protein
MEKKPHQKETTPQLLPSPMSAPSAFPVSPAYTSKRNPPPTHPSKAPINPKHVLISHLRDLPSPPTVQDRQVKRQCNNKILYETAFESTTFACDLRNACLKFLRINFSFSELQDVLRISLTISSYAL